VRAEVSFNHFGDRGRVDLIARHPTLRHLQIVEVKTEIGDLQAMLGQLDVKVRLAPSIVRDLAWTAANVIPVLVFADAARTRRVVYAHDALFRMFTLRGRAAVSWARHPTATPPSGLLWFVNLPNSRGMRVTRAKRVRKAHGARPA